MARPPRCSIETVGQLSALTMESLRCLEGKWKIAIIGYLFTRHHFRLSELERAIPVATQKMLIQQLRALERDGIVARQAYSQIPPRVDYSLTPLGRALAPAFEALFEWSDLRCASNASSE